MNYVNIENTLILNLLTTQALQNLFINLGGLNKGSFDIVKMTWADGSTITAFNYPPDFDNKKAYKFIGKIYSEVIQLSVKELSEYCNQ